MLSSSCYIEQHDCNGDVTPDIACGCQCHIPKPKPRVFVAKDVHGNPHVHVEDGSINLVVADPKMLENPAMYTWEAREWEVAQLRSFSSPMAHTIAANIEATLLHEKQQAENGEEFPDDDL